MRLLNDGMPSKTFSLDALPPPDYEPDTERREKVIRLARERYCSPKVVVEDKIMRWSKGLDVDDDANSALPVIGSTEKHLPGPKKRLMVNKNELLLKNKTVPQLPRRSPPVDS